MLAQLPIGVVPFCGLYLEFCKVVPTANSKTVVQVCTAGSPSLLEKNRWRTSEDNPQLQAKKELLRSLYVRQLLRRLVARSMVRTVSLRGRDGGVMRRSF